MTVFDTIHLDEASLRDLDPPKSLTEDPNVLLWDTALDHLLLLKAMNDHAEPIKATDWVRHERGHHDVCLPEILKVLREGKL